MNFLVFKDSHVDNSRHPEWPCEVNSVLYSKGPQCSPIVRMYPTKGQHAELYAPGKELPLQKVKRSLCFLT